MNIQIVISGDGWVLDKYANILAGQLRKADKSNVVLVNADPNFFKADITYLMNYAQLRKLSAQGIKAGEYGKVVSMLTHMEPQGELSRFWQYACEVSDALVPMSMVTANQIDDEFAHKSTIIQLPVSDIFTKRKPRVGIAACRNVANEWRKGWDLVDRLRAEHPELEIVTTGGDIPDEAMVEWYRSLDAYLCASRYEGGPMGVAEAYAMNVPLVLPRGVGWCDGYHGDCFNAGDYQSMETAVILAATHRAYACGDFAYGQEHLELFKQLVA